MAATIVCSLPTTPPAHQVNRCKRLFTGVQAAMLYTGREQPVPFLPLYRFNKRKGAGNPAPIGKNQKPGQQFFTFVDPAFMLEWILSATREKLTHCKTDIHNVNNIFSFRQ
jgi:hypothetical protein